MAKIGDVIRLNDQKNYIVVNTVDYETNTYGYLCEVDNAENVKIVQFESENKLSIIGSNEKELLTKLILLLANSDN